MPSEGDFLRLICLTAIKLWRVGGGGIRYHPTPLVGVPPPPWLSLTLVLISNVSAITLSR